MTGHCPFWGRVFTKGYYVAMPSKLLDADRVSTQCHGWGSSRWKGSLVTGDGIKIESCSGAGVRFIMVERLQKIVPSCKNHWGNSGTGQWHVHTQIKIHRRLTGWWSRQKVRKQEKAVWACKQITQKKQERSSKTSKNANIQGGKKHHEMYQTR